MLNLREFLKSNTNAVMHGRGALRAYLLTGHRTGNAEATRYTVLVFDTNLSDAIRQLSTQWPDVDVSFAKEVSSDLILTH